MTSLGVEGLKSNINNYKGVMLCTRPNENIAVSKDLPFVSRVDPKEALGLNPVKKTKVHQPMKKSNPILRRHRAWLEEFKQRMKEKKENEENKDRNDKERFDRIREQAALNKARTQDYQEEYLDALQNGNTSQNNVNQGNIHVHVQQEQSSPQSHTKPAVQDKSAKKNKKKQVKPKWAYTEQQLEEEEELDIDNLLEFTAGLDYDKYINDLEVKSMVTALKKRIDELKNKEEDEWKKKIVDEWNNEKKTIQPSKVDLNLDARSDTRSVASESRSVASERTQKSIQDIKAKMTSKEKDWDGLSNTTKKNAVTLEERIAKHVADEILRNHTEFRHFHSNASVRKILEKEAQKHLEETAGRKAPEIVSNKEYFTRKDVRDPNNLPYLHRNPAI